MNLEKEEGVNPCETNHGLKGRGLDHGRSRRLREFYDDGACQMLLSDEVPGEARAYFTSSFFLGRSYVLERYVVEQRFLSGRRCELY